VKTKEMKEIHAGTKRSLEKEREEGLKAVTNIYLYIVALIWKSLIKVNWGRRVAVNTI
jgi:hypothetical protein